MWNYQIWFRKNSVTIPTSESRITLTKQEALKVAHCILMNANREEWLDECTLGKLKTIIKEYEFRATKKD